MYDTQRMSTCMGLPRCMKLLRLLKKPQANQKTKPNGPQKLFSLGSKLMYDFEYDKAWLDEVIAKCGSVVTQVEGELTNEVLLQLTAEWASAVRTGLFSAGKKGRNQKNPSPYVVGHFVRKHALWLIQAHKDRNTCRVDYSQMTISDLGTLMPDSSDSLHRVGLSHKASVLQVAEGIDPLVTATFLCLFLPLERMPKWLSAFTNPKNHASALELITQYKSRYGVPPLPSWVARELVAAQGEKRHQPQVEDHRPRDPKGCAEAAAVAHEAPAIAKEAAQKEAGLVAQEEEGQQLPIFGGAVEEAGHEDDVTKWNRLDPAPKKKGMQCQCSGNCRRGCPGRVDGCPNVAVINVGVVKLKKLGEAAKLKGVRALCSACKCQEPGCLLAARKPFGKNWSLSNFGFCFRHQK